jgi:hypothetical protein
MINNYLFCILSISLADFAVIKHDSPRILGLIMWDDIDIVPLFMQLTAY